MFVSYWSHVPWKQGNNQRDKFNEPIAIIMDMMGQRHHGLEGDVTTKFLTDLTHQGGFRSLTWFDFAPWELPFASKMFI